MPFKLLTRRAISSYHTQHPRACKYCPKEAKVNIQGMQMRRKGYYRTCGDASCLKQQYKDTAVNQKKAYISKQVAVNCRSCNIEFVKECHNQVWCKKCVPDNASRAIMRRYSLSNTQYKALLVRNDGLCPICEKRKAVCIDHNHRTGKVRGVICYKCNLSLGLIETGGIEKLQEYLRQHESIS